MKRMKLLLASVVFMSVMLVGLPTFMVAVGTQQAHAQAQPPAPAAVAPAVVAPAVEATAEAAPVEQVKPPEDKEIKEFFQSIGGWKGLGALGLALLIGQGVALFFRSALGTFAGIYRLLIISAATWVTGVIGLKVAGLDWASAALHPASIATLGVFLNQVKVQVGKKPEDDKKLAA